MLHFHLKASTLCKMVYGYQDNTHTPFTTSLTCTFFLKCSAADTGVIEGMFPTFNSVNCCKFHNEAKF